LAFATLLTEVREDARALPIISGIYFSHCRPHNPPITSHAPDRDTCRWMRPRTDSQRTLHLRSCFSEAAMPCAVTAFASAALVSVASAPAALRPSSGTLSGLAQPRRSRH
jgi:hypothetical protein